MKFSIALFLSTFLSLTVWGQTFAPSYDAIIYKDSSATTYFQGPTEGETFTGSVDLELKRYGVFIDYEPVVVEVYDYVCPKQYYGNNKGDWKGYFNVTKSQKASALAAAVKGIGKGYAPHLVEDRSFLRRKPSTWSEFMRELYDAQERNPKALRGLVANVRKYEADNKQNLGFTVDSSYQQSCSYEVVDTYRDYQEVTKERFLNSMLLTVDLSLEGALLLEGESQQLTVNFHEIRDGEAPRYSISVPYGSKNKVVNVVNTGSVDSPSLVAQFARNPVTPSVSSAAVQVYKATGMRLGVKILDRLASRGDKYAGLMEVKMVLKRYRSLWFDEEIEEVSLSVPANQSEMVYEFSKELKSGEEYYVNYEIRRLRSPLYNTRFSSSTDTSTIEF
ncbi:MAG: hypothetical protein VX642_08770 [Bdellovibrionota bacterium]|nr:hypothetical protein [Bdellovibrionota bacterium]